MSTAGPSRPPNRRPAPQRTLKQPAALSVAESAPGVPPGARGTSTGAGDKAHLRSVLERRARLQKRADKYADKAMEEVLDREGLAKVLPYIHKAAYAEIVHERHLNGLCGYALCANPPAAPYSTAKRFSISTRARTITPVAGNDADAFCSKKCAAKSAWIAGQLGTEAIWLKGGAGESGVETVEDLEERGVVRWGGRRGEVLEWVKDGAGDAVAGDAAGAAKDIAAVDRVEPPSAAPVNGNGRAASPPPASPAVDVPAGPMGDLIASLSIYERSTPTVAPAPPSLHPTFTPAPEPAPAAPASPTEPPSPLPLPRPNSSASSTPKPNRRGPSALLSTTSTKLAQSLLTATKTLPTPHVDSDSGDESAPEEDWAREMGWGQGKEVDDLFAMAREAREMMGE